MEIVINQEELKGIVKNHIEKQGHAVKSVEVFISQKQSDEMMRMPQLRAQPYNYASSTEFLNVQNLQSLLDRVSFYVLCKVDS